MTRHGYSALWQLSNDRVLLDLKRNVVPQIAQLQMPLVVARDADDIGLNRAKATTKTWTNGTGADTIDYKDRVGKTPSQVLAQLPLQNLVCLIRPQFASGGMLAHQTFTAVSLTSGDSITVTWTFTVGN